jgi:hypothetical protein
MVWIPDMSRQLPNADLPSGRGVAVGWLARGHAFTRGEVDSALVDKLVELLANAWKPWSESGVHACDLCGDAVWDDNEGSGGAFGSENLFVPDDQSIFIAPELITHYIQEHGYAPPGEFQRAVMQCPPPGTVEYFQAMTKVEPSWSEPELWPHGSFRADQVSDSAMAELARLWERGFATADVLAYAYAARGRVDEALDWVRRAHDQGTLGLEELRSDERLSAIRSDARVGSLIREMARVIPCVYETGTAGLPPSTPGALHLVNKDKIVFHYGGSSAGLSEGALEIPCEQITKLELSSTETFLMIRYNERPGKYPNAGFDRSTEHATRAWSAYTLQILEVMTGKPIARPRG